MSAGSGAVAQAVPDADGPAEVGADDADEAVVLQAAASKASATSPAARCRGNIAGQGNEVCPNALSR